MLSLGGSVVIWFILSDDMKYGRLDECCRRVTSESLAFVSVAENIAAAGFEFDDAIFGQDDIVERSGTIPVGTERGYPHRPSLGGLTIPYAIDSRMLWRTHALLLPTASRLASEIPRYPNIGAQIYRRILL